jgi:hypothetical protein
MRYLDLANPRKDGGYDSYTEDAFRSGCPNCGDKVRKLTIRKRMKHKGKNIYEWTEHYYMCAAPAKEDPKDTCCRIYTGVLNLEVEVLDRKIEEWTDEALVEHTEGVEKETDDEPEDKSISEEGGKG